MAHRSTDVETSSRPRNWRHRENRASSKLVAKRISEEDHSALTRYAEARGVKVAELLAPAVDDLIQLARQFCDQADARPQVVKAS